MDLGGAHLALAEIPDRDYRCISTALDSTNQTHLQQLHPGVARTAQA